MFNKKPPSDQLNQSQSLQNVQITNAAVQLSQAGRDAIATQSADLNQQQTAITAPTVVQLLEELEDAVIAAALPAPQQKKALAYLEPAKLEAAETNPDRESIAQNLKKVSEAIEGLDKATEAGKNLWEKGQAVFGAIAPWLGVAAKFFGM
jgi:hypothetical protein